MIFMTALGIGLAAGMTRSAISIALAASAICIIFALSSILTATFSLGMLFSAIAGYNGGLIVLMTAHLAMAPATGKTH